MAMSAFLPTNTSKYFLPPPTAGPSPPEEYLYGRSAYAAASSMPPTPPSNTSPTNQYNVHVRQLRQPRQPMYIPAALRPTELRQSDLPTGRDIPNRPRPLDTPPASQGNSYDSANSSSPAYVNPLVTLDAQHEAGSSYDMNAADGGLTIAYDEVTGPPTTAHWKPDASSATCAVCNVQFTWYFRRHHCRRCGKLVCENHVRATVPLDQNARFHLKGTPSKACNPCHDEWKYLVKLREERLANIRDGWTTTSSSPTLDHSALAMSIPQSQRAAEEPRVGSMARSEGYIAWSTF